MSGHNIDYEARKAARLARKIPGQFGERESEYLYKLARQKGNLVEIGALFGRSTSVMVQASKIFSAHLTTIDPFFKTPNTDQLSSPELWRSNLIGEGLEPPDLLHMKSHEAASVYDKDISLVFIDGGHNYETVKEDIEDWSPKVKVGGIMALHDMYMPHLNGITRAVNEWWLEMFETRAWKIEGMVGYTISFRRFA